MLCRKRRREGDESIHFEPLVCQLKERVIQTIQEQEGPFCPDASQRLDWRGEGVVTSVLRDTYYSLVGFQDHLSAGGRWDDNFISLASLHPLAASILLSVGGLVTVSLTHIATPPLSPTLLGLPDEGQATTHSLCILQMTYLMRAVGLLLEERVGHHNACEGWDVVNPPWAPSPIHLVFASRKGKKEVGNDDSSFDILEGVVQTSLKWNTPTVFLSIHYPTSHRSCMVPPPTDNRGTPFGRHDYTHLTRCVAGELSMRHFTSSRSATSIFTALPAGCHNMEPNLTPRSTAFLCGSQHVENWATIQIFLVFSATAGSQILYPVVCVEVCWEVIGVCEAQDVTEALDWLWGIVSSSEAMAIIEWFPHCHSVGRASPKILQDLSYHRRAEKSAERSFLASWHCHSLHSLDGLPNGDEEESLLMPCVSTRELGVTTSFNVTPLPLHGPWGLSSVSLVPN